MAIRDDRGRGIAGANREFVLSQILRPKTRARYPAYFAPDAVLHDCPDCGRAHFVTVGVCPTEAGAAGEVGQVDGVLK